MAAYEHELSPPPKGERARELWIQHAAGFILFEDSRAYAIGRIDPRLDPKTRAAVVKGIDDALYGLMMIVDGVSGSLASESDEVTLAMTVRHSRRSSGGDSEMVAELDLGRGDGMCMGIAGWWEGDFGVDPPARVRPASPAKASAKPRPSRRKKIKNAVTRVKKSRGK